MAATLKSLGAERDVERRIAVLGPMRELGEHSDALHAGLAPAVLDAQGRPADPDRRGDAAAGGAARRQASRVDLRRRTSTRRPTRLLPMLRPGDAVLVKASNSVGLAKLVERVAKEACACST